ncbi:hypothetical protein [Xanthomonas sacchari]|uniref:hypothetical protein n=1 Tax=Xanthomonas sacchari TaxID=56458 RepID=UPI00225E4589|nr:hypothetical protein [Xanthomonas sacchari]
MLSAAEFYVEEVVKDRLGRTVFVGVPNQGRGIRVGDKFVFCYEVPRTLDDVLNDRPRAEPVNQLSVALRVAAIDSMRRSVQELPLGVTGGIYLEGNGVEHVGRRKFLKTSESDI